MKSLKATETMEATETIGKRVLEGCGTDSNGGSPSFYRRVSPLALLGLLIIGTFIFQGCKGSGNGTTVSSISITPTAASVPINTQTEFTATVNLNDSTTSPTTTVTWEVNGISGGNISTVGSIVPSTADALVGVYTAPPVVPTTTTSGVTQIGQVNITAVASQVTTTTSTTGSTTGTVTSNIAVVTVGAGLGLTVVNPTCPTTIPAGGSCQFSALNNGLADSNVTWTLSPVGEVSVYGSINANGLYTAPLSPPPGQTITVTATDPAAPAPATATATVVYSDQSLNGPYAFFYTGNDNSGFLAIAGSFTANGSGRISGIEDVDSFLTGISTVAISGTYLVGPDGRATATINSSLGAATWQFALTTNQHAEFIRLDKSVTGGGTIDQQSVDAIGNSISAISGPYVFNLLGADTAFKPLGMAGKFSADGSGNIPEPAQPHTILDVNDNGAVTTNDTSLQGTYQLDSLSPGTGRGTLTLTSTTTGQRRYAFYAVDAPANLVTHLYLIETDTNASVAGDMFSAPAGPATLTAGNYVFTAGGNSGGGAYAAGAVFTSDGVSNITGGVFDSNSAGTYNHGPAINSCPYGVDGVTGRIDLKLCVGATTPEFAFYQTSQATALMLELDSSAISTGVAYEQCVPGATACPTNLSLAGTSAAIGLDGQGIFHNSPASYQSMTEGQLSLAGLGLSGGNLDINNFNAVFSPDPINVTGSSIGIPATNGRGTAIVAASTPTATYNLIYYLIDDNTALLFDQDTTRIAIGSVARQF